METDRDTLPRAIIFHTHAAGSENSLVQQFETRLTHTHFLLDAKFWNGGVLRGALSTENLAAGSTVVLEKQGRNEDESRSTSAHKRHTNTAHTAVNE